MQKIDSGILLIIMLFILLLLNLCAFTNAPSARRIFPPFWLPSSRRVVNAHKLWAGHVQASIRRFFEEGRMFENESARGGGEIVSLCVHTVDLFLSKGGQNLCIRGFVQPRTGSGIFGVTYYGSKTVSSGAWERGKRLFSFVRQFSTAGSRWENVSIDTRESKFKHFQNGRNDIGKRDINCIFFCFRRCNEE